MQWFARGCGVGCIEKKKKHQRDKSAVDTNLTGDSVDILMPQGFWQNKK
jgi:hypothetical protein